MYSITIAKSLLIFILRMCRVHPRRFSARLMGENVIKLNDMTVYLTLHHLDLLSHWFLSSISLICELLFYDLMCAVCGNENLKIHLKRLGHALVLHVTGHQSCSAKYCKQEN